MYYLRIVLICLFFTSVSGASVTSVNELVDAVNQGEEGAMIEIGPGIYELSAPLEPKAGMRLKGAGLGKTIITHAAGWRPSTKSLPDPEVKMDGLDSRAYLVRLNDKASNINRFPPHTSWTSYSRRHFRVSK